MTRTYNPRPSNCVTCGLPLRDSTAPADGTTRRYAGRGLCSTCRARIRTGARPRGAVGSGVRCGTPSGYTTHYQLKQKPCDACRAANNEYRRKNRAQRKALGLDAVGGSSTVQGISTVRQHAPAGQRVHRPTAKSGTWWWDCSRDHQPHAPTTGHAATQDAAHGALGQHNDQHHPEIKNRPGYRVPLEGAS